MRFIDYLVMFKICLTVYLRVNGSHRDTYETAASTSRTGGEIVTSFVSSYWFKQIVVLNLRK